MADQGLFGPSPWEVQQAQQAAQQQNMMDMSAMDATRLGKYGMLSAGSGLGGLLAQKMGGRNVAVENAQRSEQIMGAEGTDLSTSVGIMAKANEFRQAGDLRMAGALMMKANELKKQEAADKLKQRELDIRESQWDKSREYQQLLEMYQNAPDEQKPLIKARLDFLATSTGGRGGAGGTGTPQFERGDDGIVYKMNKATGQATPVLKPDGTPLKAAEASPELKAQMAYSAESGKKIAGASTDALIQLPRVELDYATVTDLGNKLFNHPGYKALVGAGWPGWAALSGSNVPGAKAMVDQIEGIVGLMSRKEMRGEGQITESEANAALRAYSRLTTSQSEADFRDAYSDLLKRLDGVRTILRNQSKMRPGQQPAAAATPVSQNRPMVDLNDPVVRDERIKILQSELNAPGRTEPDKAAIRREIAAVSGNKTAQSKSSAIPAGSVKIGKTPDGKTVFKSPDGKNWVE